MKTDPIPVVQVAPKMVTPGKDELKTYFPEHYIKK